MSEIAQAIDQTFREIAASHPFEAIKVAYSGGMDSTVLLQAVVEWAQAQGVALEAWHVNHGIQAQAGEWSLHCRRQCESLGVAFREFIVADAPPEQGSIESWARDQRYGLWAQALPEQALLITAHHQRDQAETLLLQLFRGCGLEGLAAMPKLRPLGKGYLCRPLLTVPYDALMAHAQSQQLVWVEDPSNGCCELRRNFIRHQVLPLLQSHHPSLIPNLARTSQHCQSAMDLLKQALQPIWRRVVVTTEPLTLNAKVLRTFSPELQNQCLRYWLQQLGLTHPTTAQLESCRQQLIASVVDARPRFLWGGNTLTRYRDVLYCIEATIEPPKTPVSIAFRPEATVRLPGFVCEQWQWHAQIGVGIAVEKLNHAPLTVSPRQGGERFHPAGRVGAHPLKKCFQEWHIPPWQRNLTPLLWSGEELIAVLGHAIADAAHVEPEALGWQLVPIRA